MPHIRRMLNEIIHKGSVEDMEKVGDMFVGAVYARKYTDHMRYIQDEYELHIMAYGHHLTEEQAKCWVMKMENVDNSSMPHWTMEQTESVNKHGCHKYDFYAAIHMMFSDYFSTKKSNEDYALMAHQYLSDKDGEYDRIVKDYYRHKK